MFTSIRLFIALFVLLTPLLRHLWPARPAGTFRGRPYTLQVARPRHGPSSVALGMTLESGVAFVLHAEQSADRLFKRMGLAEEFQTGDRAFDDQIYVGSDHQALHTMLRDQPELRRVLLALFASGVSRVWSDGHLVRVVRMGTVTQGPDDLERLSVLREQLARLPALARGRADPYVWKIALVEGVCGSILTYGFLSLPFWLHASPSVVLRSMDLVGPTIFIGVALVLAVFAAVAIWLQGSSRAHRVLVECNVLLLLGLPLAAWQLAKDVNVGLDHGPSTELRCTAYHKTFETGRGKTRSYFVDLNNCQSEVALPYPDQLTVDATTYNALDEGDTLVARIGAGTLHIPWIRSLDVAPADGG